jgi:hypothetical protein
MSASGATMLDSLVQAIKARSASVVRQPLLTPAIVSIQSLLEALKFDEDALPSNILVLLETRLLVGPASQDFTAHLAMRQAQDAAEHEFEMTINLKDSLAKHASLDATLAAVAAASNWRACETKQLFAYEAGATPQLFAKLTDAQLRLVRDYCSIAFPARARELGDAAAAPAPVAARKSKRGSHVGSFNMEAYALAASIMKAKSP